jgi:erythrocyte band 7 integral membrane protein
LRTGAFDVPPQEILTHDSVTVSVDAVVYYQVSNPLAAVCNNDDYNRSTRLLAATTLRYVFLHTHGFIGISFLFRNVLGTKNLSEVFSERESIGDSMHRILEVATDTWGVHVDRVELKDVRLPQQMQRAMVAEAEATRDARAKGRNIKGGRDR